MKIFKGILFGSLLTLFALLASAHPNHGDEAPISSAEASAIGSRAVSLLIDNRKLAESWQQKQLREVTSRQTSAGLVWVVRYENANEEDKTKRTLYIFVDEFGGFIGGNHSGNF